MNTSIDLTGDEIESIEITADGLDDHCFLIGEHLVIQMSHEQMEAFFNAMKPWFIDEPSNAPQG